MSRRRLKCFALFPFRSFGLASAYAFLSAIFLSLSANLFVSVRLSQQLAPEQIQAFYLSALFYLVSAVGFFIVTWTLENARSQWVAEGARQNDRLLLEPIEMRKWPLYLGLLFGLAGCLAGSCLVTLKFVP